MQGRGIVRSVVFVLVTGLVAGICILSCLADEREESITITTYYPSPYGAYNELKTKKLAVGDTDQPGREGSIKFAPQGGDPISDWPAGKTGELAYSSVNNSFYYYDGSGWQPFGGGGGVSFTYYCFQYLPGEPACADAGGTQGYCPAGFRQERALGAWGYCYSDTTHDYQSPYFFPPGCTDCHPTFTARLVGEAYLCSQ
jgi:hypothetical protein